MQTLTDPTPAPRAVTGAPSRWRLRAKAAVLAAVAIAGAASGAPRWEVLAVALGCLAIPVAVAIQDGLDATRALLFIRPVRSRPGSHKEEINHAQERSRRPAAGTR